MTLSNTRLLVSVELILHEAFEIFQLQQRFKKQIPINTTLASTTHMIICHHGPVVICMDLH